MAAAIRIVSLSLLYDRTDCLSMQGMQEKSRKKCPEVSKQCSVTSSSIAGKITALCHFLCFFPEEPLRLASSASNSSAEQPDSCIHCSLRCFLTAAAFASLIFCLFRINRMPPAMTASTAAAPAARNQRRENFIAGRLPGSDPSYIPSGTADRVRRLWMAGLGVIQAWPTVRSPYR